MQNFAANVALAIGASPIMSNHGDEAADLARHKGSLVLNMGTVDEKALGNYVKSLRAYNQANQPVVFDPVGYGSSFPLYIDSIQFTDIGASTQCRGYLSKARRTQDSPGGWTDRRDQGQRK